jgi:transcription-repair coupling factor (superfamily II helicase)
LKPDNLLKHYHEHPRVIELFDLLESSTSNIRIQGQMGSAVALTVATVFDRAGKQQHLIVLPDKEQAAYFYNDLENLFGELETDYNKKKILFYPTSYKRPYEPENPDRSYQLSRTEVLKRFISGDRKTIVVSYPEALSEKVIT